MGVFAVGRRVEKLNETKALCKSPEKVVIIQADVTSEEGREKVNKAIGNTELRFLIQNAGVVGPLVHVRDLNAKDFQQVMGTNVEVRPYD